MPWGDGMHEGAKEMFLTASSRKAELWAQNLGALKNSSIGAFCLIGALCSIDAFALFVCSRGMLIVDPIDPLGAISC
jgi:hypothetical protein